MKNLNLKVEKIVTEAILEALKSVIFEESKDVNSCYIEFYPVEIGLNEIESRSMQDIIFALEKKYKIRMVDVFLVETENTMFNRLQSNSDLFFFKFRNEKCKLRSPIPIKSGFEFFKSMPDLSYLTRK